MIAGIGPVSIVQKLLPTGTMPVRKAVTFQPSRYQDGTTQRAPACIVPGRFALSQLYSTTMRGPCRRVGSSLTISLTSFRSLRDANTKRSAEIT